MSKQIPEMLESFSQLVAAPSVSSTDPQWDQSNRVVVDLLAGWLEDIGFKVEVMPVPVEPGFSSSEEKFNLIACLDGGKGGGEGGLVLSGHTDTVPFSADSWHQDPFKLTEKEGRIHGLGICDMKSFFPIVMEVAQQLNVREMKQPLYVLATADEESTMSGARALAGYGKSLGRHALIGEPTGLMPVYMHKGILTWSLSRSRVRLGIQVILHWGIVPLKGCTASSVLSCNGERNCKSNFRMHVFLYQSQRLILAPSMVVITPTGYVLNVN